jgi:glutathione S-transferase
MRRDGWGPQGFTPVSCRLDASLGGTFRIAMRGPDGTVYTKRGVYREIAEPERLVFTYAWEDANGNPGHEMQVTVTFGPGLPDRSKFEVRIPDLTRYAKGLDGHLDGRTHFACGRLTIADFQLAFMATDWREAEMPLESFRNNVRWNDALMRLPAWADPWPAGASTRS